MGDKLREGLGGGKIGIQREQREPEKLKDKGDKVKASERQKRGKAHASRPAVRGECNSWLGADAGLLDVFIDLQGFNPQYWPKPLAEGSQPT